MIVHKTSGFPEEFIPGAITASLMKELNIESDAASTIEQKVIGQMIAWNLLSKADGEYHLLDNVSGSMIRELAAMVMRHMGKPDLAARYASIGMSVYDAEQIDLGSGYGKHDNANMLEIPETAAKNKAGAISKKQYLLTLPRKAVEMHQRGDIHIHDLDYFRRPFCRSHDLRYFFYYGFMPDGSGMSISAAGPAKHANVAIDHAAKVLGTSQCLHSGGQGLLHFLTFIAPYLEGLSYKEIYQLMQRYIYEMNQMLVARGGQSLAEQEKIILRENGEVRNESIGAFCKRFQASVGARSLENIYIETPSVNRIPGKVEWKRVTAVHVHSPASRMARTVLVDGRTILTTTDHSLFTIDSGKLTEVSPSEKPDTIVTSARGKIYSSKVASIGIEDYKYPYVYDISVQDNENFITANGILAHNTVFSSINLTPGVPEIFRDVPIIHAGKRYDGEQAPLRVYGEFEREVRLAFKAIFQILQKGDRYGKPFFFPKPEVQIDWEFIDDDKPLMVTKHFVKNEIDNSERYEFVADGKHPVLRPGETSWKIAVEEIPSYKDLYELAFLVAAEQGATYFENHLVDPPMKKKGISCFQCCAFRFSKSESDVDFLDQLTFKDGKHFSLGGYQVVSINMVNCAMGEDHDLITEEDLMENVHRRMDAAIEVFKFKKQEVEKIKHQLGFLTQTPPDPITGLPGDPYTNFNDLSWEIGVVGVNEMVQAFTGHQLHEWDEAKALAERVMSDMYLYAKSKGDELGMHISVARTPAETTAQRFAVIGLKGPNGSEYEQVVKGDLAKAKKILAKNPRATDLPIYLSNGFSAHVGAKKAGVPLSIEERAELEEF